MIFLELLHAQPMRKNSINRKSYSLLWHYSPSQLMLCFCVSFTLRISIMIHGSDKKPSIWKLFIKETIRGRFNIKKFRKECVSNGKVIRPGVMEKKFLSNFKSYVHIYQGFHREFFTKVLD